MKAKKNKTTQTKSLTLNPYVTLFELGGGLSATPSYLSDIEEVSDTVIDPNLKLNNKKNFSFDTKSLAPVAKDMTNLGSNIIAKNSIDDRGFQDPTKAGIAGGLKGLGDGVSAGLATGNPLVGLGVGVLSAGLNIYQDTKNAKAQNKQLSQDLGNYFAGLPKMTSANPYKMKMGGDKSLNNFNGESHENGGIRLTEGAEVEGGETSYKDYVFSDTLKVPGKKITFAQATKRIEAKYKGRENDQYSERAKEQALTEYMKQNEMVKAMEEAKQTHIQQMEEIKMRFGGLKTHMMPDGSIMEGAVHKMVRGGKKPIGILPDMENDNSFVDYNVGEGSLPDMYKRSYLPKEPQLRNDGFDRTDVGTNTINNSEVDDVTSLKSSENTSYNKKKFKIGNEEMALGLSMLPGLYNVAKGWKPDVTNFQTTNPILVNLESERENLRREAGKARLIANENIRNIGGGSGSALAALATQSSAINDSKMKALSDSYQREHLANVTTLNDFLVRNNSIINEEYVANEQNKAMTDSLKSLGLSDLSNNAQSYMRDKSLSKENKRANDLKLNIMNQLFANYEWGKDPNKDNQMQILFKEGMGSIGMGGLGLLGENGTTSTTTTTNSKTGAKTVKTTTNNKSKKK